ncbi:MAG: RNHCP domain-containing protein [Acholeplasmatales bacterium]|jgi:DNA-directed RNA polymerase subunit RPC12/RpoP|nr:RNHCP domain-containing protein [Acholeplasmatales bacterium]
MKKFLKNDTKFICSNCGKEVEVLGYTSRDHCPFCLYSIHIDNNPGDRSCDCLGMLEPIGIDYKSSKTQIVYRCVKCKTLKKNIVANDDNQEKIIELSLLGYK